MRNLGTNNYSNNFEPQVKSLLDARTKAPTAAALLTKEQWTSSDGNEWVPVAIRVSVVEDPDPVKNGIYVLMKEDYTKEENWLQVGANSDKIIQLDMNRIGAILDGTATSEQIIEAVGQDNLNKLTAPGKLYVEFTNIYPMAGTISSFYSERTFYMQIEGNISFGVNLPIETNTMWTVEYSGGKYSSSQAPIIRYSSTIDKDSNEAVRSSAIYNEFQRTNSRFRTLKTVDLLKPDRVDTVDLSSDDVAVLKSMVENGSLYYYGNIFGNSTGQRYMIVPLSIQFEDDKPVTGKGYFIYLYYTLMGIQYEITAYFTETNTCSATPPEVIEVSSPNIVFLNTNDLIDPYRNVNVTFNKHDTEVIKKLFDSSNSEEKTIVYNGTLEGNQLLVHLNVYADFGSTNVYMQNVTFIHPFYQVGYSFEINTYDADGSLYATPLVPCTPGIYRSKFTSEYILDRASGFNQSKPELTESDADEVKRILRHSLDGYTIKLADSRENYSTMGNESGYFGAVNVSVSAFSLDNPYTVGLTLESPNYIIRAIADLDSMIWSVSKTDDNYLQTIEGKSDVKYLPTPIIDAPNRSITWEITERDEIQPGQYILNLSIYFQQGTTLYSLLSSNAISFNTGESNSFLVTALTRTSSQNLLAAGLITNTGNNIISLVLYKVSGSAEFTNIKINKATLTKL